MPPGQAGTHAVESAAVRSISRLRRRAAGVLRDSGDQRRDAPDLDGALRRYRAALAVGEPRFGTLTRVARAATLCGQPDLAERCWKAAAALRPDDPEPPARLARFAALAGRVEQGLGLARQSLARETDGEGRSKLAAGVESLIAHLERAPATEPTHRHVALCGVSYCGSTLVSYFLGSLPGVANVGESHWLVHRVDRSGGGFRAVAFDFETGEPGELPVCGSCGSLDCPVLGLELRQALARDPVDWFDRIASAQNEPVLVSSDKNHGSLVRLDPWLRLDAVVLFRPPLHAWASTRAKHTNQRNVAEYLRAWDLEYRSFVHDFPNQGRKLFVDFEIVRRDLPRHLETLCTALGLPFDARFVADVDRSQHAIGGNVRVHRSLREDQPVEVVAADAVEMPAEEREAVARFEARSPVLAAMRAGHASVFS